MSEGVAANPGAGQEAGSRRVEADDRSAVGRREFLLGSLVSAAGFALVARAADQPAMPKPGEHGPAPAAAPAAATATPASPFAAYLEIRADGRLEERSILKGVWHEDFAGSGGEFLRGLEEILYAEIFAVKRHLGKEYESQILQWIRNPGN